MASGELLVGRYRVLSLLGTGGMASVHLARDETLDRLVAVKRLPADSPEDVAERFHREARTGAALNHPNLVTVFDTSRSPKASRPRSSVGVRSSHPTSMAGTPHRRVGSPAPLTGVRT
jgi:serine/threonine protein kinase